MAAGLPEVPQDEFELVGRLYPESAWMFVWARRILRDLVGDRVSRFLVGRLEPGCWSVLHDGTAWTAVRCADQTTPATPTHTASFTSAQDAVAHATAGVITDQDVTIHADFLMDAGILERVWDGPRTTWALTDRGQRLLEAARDSTHPAYGDSGVILDLVLGRSTGYRVFPRVPRPDSGPFIGAHQIFTAYVQDHLPGDFCASTGEELPADTLLDGYATTDEPYLFTLETPYSYHVYRVLRPIRVKPITLEARTIYREGERGPKRLPEHKGQAFDLDRPIRDLLESGDLVEITEPGGTPLPLRDYWEDL